MVVNKVSDYIGKFNAVCFSPEDVSLFKDSPSVRRQFLDKELSSLFPIYIKQLIAFKSLLDERNALLKKNAEQLKTATIETAKEAERATDVSDGEGCHHRRHRCSDRREDS